MTAVTIRSRPNKYGARRTTVGDLTFASAKEARRWGELVLMVRAGQIADLVRQPRYDITINGFKVCTYVADASYVESGQLVVEDVKGGAATKTPLYRLKAKLMRAVHGISVREV